MDSKNLCLAAVHRLNRSNALSTLGPGSCRLLNQMGVSVTWGLMSSLQCDSFNNKLKLPQNNPLWTGAIVQLGQMILNPETLAAGHPTLRECVRGSPLQPPWSHSIHPWRRSQIHQFVITLEMKTGCSTLGRILLKSVFGTRSNQLGRIFHPEKVHVHAWPRSSEVEGFT